MIPFASQRGGGQDLATHLMNAQDNERIELFQVRGAIAHDLHGAFAEWEAIGKALTRARQYLCCLSVNPDERQGRLTRDQYLDYIDRAESSLGLTGQPRAIIFHEKRGEEGAVREHCHVVWSRTDVKGERAIPLPFFKEKLMAVTREFARDHGLRLPPGYDRQADEARRNRQLSAYDCVKQKETGVSHEERMAAVIGAWRRSDSARAFVAALEDLGYVLARGRNQTRIVLVDFYGHTTALTRLIDDASVRARHVRAFLGADYAPENLPTVEQAQEQAAQRRAAIEAFEAAARESDDQAEQLARQQARRREDAQAQAALLRRQHHEERVQLAAVQKEERQRLKASYLAAQRRIRRERDRRRPRGLAAFLGRVSGVSLVIRKVQRYRDRKRYAAYLVWREELRRRQKEARETLSVQQALQMADIERLLRSLDQIEQRERETLTQTRRRERRQRFNARHEHMPAMAPLVTAPEQSVQIAAPAAAPETVLARQMAEAAQLLKDGRRIIHLAEVFERVSGGGGDESGEGAATEGPAPVAEAKIRRRRERQHTRKMLITSFASAADEGHAKAADTSSNDPNPVAQGKPKRRRKQQHIGEASDRKSERLRAFNDAARGREDEGESAGGTGTPAPAADAKIRRRKRRRRLDRNPESNSVSGAAGGGHKDGDSDGEPRKRKRRRRAHDPPEPGGPSPPHRRRKPKFGPGM